MKKVKKMAFGGPAGSTSMPVTPAAGGRPNVPPGLARAAAASGRDFSGIAGGKFAPPPPPSPISTTPAPAPTGGLQFQTQGPESLTGSLTRPAYTNPMNSWTTMTDQQVNDLAAKGIMLKKGGKVKKMASGGKVGSASKRGDGCAQRGKTRGRMV